MSELRSQLTEASDFRLQLIEMYFTGVVAGLIWFDGSDNYLSQLNMPDEHEQRRLYSKLNWLLIPKPRLSEINEIAKELTKTHFHDPYYQVELEYFLNRTFY